MLFRITALLLTDPENAGPFGNVISHASLEMLLP